LPSSVQKFALSGSGIRRGCAVIAAAVACVILLGEASRANWLTDALRGTSSKPDKSDAPAASTKRAAAPKRAEAAKHVATPKPTNVKLAALGPLNPSALKLATAACEPAKFRIVLDVGHTPESEGATSSRNVPEFAFNLRLAQRVEEKLKAEGFAETRLLVTEGKARPSLARRVATANDFQAKLFLSIHHDSVPNKFLEEWEVDGKKSHYSDRFGGYSVFVSTRNPEFKTSLVFAELVAKEMKASGLKYADQYSLPVMGRYQHPLLNKETGVYSYDKLVVLRTSRMPAVLLEAGSIINRDEELKMDSSERRDVISSAVAAAVKKFCGAPEPFLGPP